MIFDLESDGLEIEDVTQIHCVSYQTFKMDKPKTIFDKGDIVDIFNNAPIAIGHNVVRYDFRVLKKVYGIDYKGKIYDTLPMAWVFDDDRPAHGLDPYGDFFKVPKPKVQDWKGQAKEVYKHRCEEDVKINKLLWDFLIKKAKLVYGTDRENLDKFLQYLTFKMQCAAEQEEIGWKVNIQKAQGHLKDIHARIEEKHNELKTHMPAVIKHKEVRRPEKDKKKDGTPTVAYTKWIELLDFHGLDHDYVAPIKVIDKVDDPNPGSHVQVKDWLFSLGWRPCTFDYKKEKNGKERRVPQVRKDGELTPSVEKLAEKHEGVKVLADLSILQHRETVFKGLLESVDEKGFVKAEIAGLTNTLRFKHKKPICNLPGVTKAWGKEVRGCLIAPDENHILCGSDMVSLEATTKAHYLYDYDPDYALALTHPDFDEHLDLAVSAGKATEDDMHFYIDIDKGRKDLTDDLKERFSRIKSIRKFHKPVNYGAQYGIGKDKLAREMDSTVQEASKLLKGYWDRNWAIEEVVKSRKKKLVNGKWWIRNEVNQFWYRLRFEKDAWSTTNQGTGAFCFDTWTAYCRAMGVKMCGQFHDEHISPLKVEDKEEHERKLKKAIELTNKKLKLNVKLDVSVQFGKDYSQIH